MNESLSFRIVKEYSFDRAVYAATQQQRLGVFQEYVKVYKHQNLQYYNRESNAMKGIES